MKTKTKKIFGKAGLIFVATVIFLGLSSTAVTFAQTVNTGGANSVNTPTSATIANPLKVNSIQCFISEALKYTVDILAIAAVVYIMWAGFLFVKAQGNPEELKVAKAALLHALIGTALVLGAWALATVISNTVNQVTKSNNGLPSQNSCSS